MDKNLWLWGCIGLGATGLIRIMGSVGNSLLDSSSRETVRIASCYDGDTCTTSAGEKIRLACIDAPEMDVDSTTLGLVNYMNAAYARDELRDMVVGEDVGIRRITTGPYGRTIAELYLGSKNVGQEMARSLYVNVDQKYAYQCDWAS